MRDHNPEPVGGWYGTLQGENRELKEERHRLEREIQQMRDHVDELVATAETAEMDSHDVLQFLVDRGTLVEVAPFRLVTRWHLRH